MFLRLEGVTSENGGVREKFHQVCRHFQFTLNISYIILHYLYCFQGRFRGMDIVGHKGWDRWKWYEFLEYSFLLCKSVPNSVIPLSLRCFLISFFDLTFPLVTSTWENIASLRTNSWCFDRNKVDFLRGLKSLGELNIYFMSADGKMYPQNFCVCPLSFEN